ncbi:putative zinc-finger domain, NURS complex subunit red1 [Dioscorea sansibarensis]
MESKIDELRAKAIASLPSSSPNPSPPRQPKSSGCREEGELSPGYEAEAGASVSSALQEIKTSIEPDPSPVAIASSKSMKTSMPTSKTEVNQYRTGHSVMTHMQQLQRSVALNYNQCSKKKKATFKSESNRNLSWHGKGSNANLVISFSDDDSESGPEECRQENTLGEKVDLARAKMSSTPPQLQTEVLQHTVNTRAKQVWKKESACMPSISTNFKKPGTKDRGPLASLVDKELNIQGNSFIAKGSSSLEIESQRSANLANKQLASLRRQIAERENELRVQRENELRVQRENELRVQQENELRVQRENELRVRQKSTFQSKEMVSSLYSNQRQAYFMKRDAQVAGINVLASANTIGLPPKEQALKRAKLDENAHNKLSSGDQVQGQVLFGTSHDDMGHHGNSGGTKDASLLSHSVHVPVSSEAAFNTRKGNESLGPTHEAASSMVGSLGIPLQLQSKIKFSSGISCSLGESHDGNLQRDSNTLTNRPPVDQMILSFERLPDNSHLNISRKSNASPMFLEDATYKHELERSQQTIPTVGIGMPLSTSTNTLEKYSVSVPMSKLVTDATTVSREGNTNLQTLIELEELHDKELEEAQELRRRCEVEERRALIAYREAQRALIEANEKCTILYRKRELFSCQARALMMEASSSMWPSSWQSSRGTRMDLSKTAPSASCDLLQHVEHEMPANCQAICELGYESSIQCPDVALVDLSSNPINVFNYGSEPAHEPNRDSSEPKDGIGTIDENAFANSNEENFLCDNSIPRSGISCNITDGNNAKELVNKPSNENAHDFELEASLRSQLVARLGKKSSLCKSSDGSKTSTFDKEALSADVHKKPCTPSILQSLEGEKKQIPSFRGIEKPQSCFDDSSSQAFALPHENNNSSNEDFVRKNYTVDEPHKISNPGNSNSISKESCWQVGIPVLSLPSLGLHIVSRHAKLLLSESDHEFPEKDSVSNIPPVVVVECMPGREDNSSRVYGGNIEKDSQSRILSIDSFWPFCMFELRGRCNDEECPWQHFKNLKPSKDSVALGSDSQVGHPLTLGKTAASFGSHYGIDRNLLPIPTYQIGLYLLKASSHLSQSILARCSWQYWQRGFSTCSILPFSFQRVLPPDAPCLQSDDDHSADDHKRNRPAFHFQCPDGILIQAMKGLTDSEQSLELALDLFNGTFNRPDQKQVVHRLIFFFSIYFILDSSIYVLCFEGILCSEMALSLLSRSIEAYPSSVKLWVIYLHIYYCGGMCQRNDDLFPYAVEHNKHSYELWLMYINSRKQLSDQLNAYVSALNAFSDEVDASDKARKYISACILDIFLQMVDFLQMSDNADWAIDRIYQLVRPNSNSNDKLLSNLYSQLILSDRCMFWFCCVYLTIYKRLPEAIVLQFELDKELPFEYEWPCALVGNYEKGQALDIMRFAIDKLTLDHDDNYGKDHVDQRPLHFLVICHLRCVAALEGLHCLADLLVKYMRVYPTCIELILLSVRLTAMCREHVVLQGFEETLSDWPKEISGVQCVWNQYFEFILKEGAIELAQKVIDRWYHNFSCVKQDTETGNTAEMKNDSVKLPSHAYLSTSRDDIFSVLNLSLYKLLHKDHLQASAAISKALKLATLEDFKHCVREHAAFMMISKSKDVKDVPGVLLGLIKSYLSDCRFSIVQQPLSRRYHQNIKKSRIRQLVNKILGPASVDYSLVNSVLEACYGPSLLPEHFEKPKDLVDFVEPLMEVAPSNYLLALSVYKLTGKTFNLSSVVYDAVMFWATTLLVNSILQAIPVAPEQIWFEAANAMKDFECRSITQWFHQLAVSVYPFSVRLWRSYLDISKETGNADLTVKMAKERGIEL